MNNSGKTKWVCKFNAGQKGFTVDKVYVFNTESPYVKDDDQYEWAIGPHEFNYPRVIFRRLFFSDYYEKLQIMAKS